MLETLLAELGIGYHDYHHPPLNDCSEADRLALDRDGQRTKNLFLRDNYGRRHFILVTAPDKQVDLKALSRQMALSRLGFASTERLARYLDLKPGRVSLLALVNDPDKAVELWIDKALWHDEGLHCHPLDNTRTWVIPPQGIERLLAHWGRPLTLITVPEL
ncbi:prolyl-tRNA synthetase associated domain-containing protein [Ferrimonas balearica]|uniref:prolyl-tRNA synthetase associated domain-containing protein n=1 Tax=Ferrimonas balearica TaxID=44012 RepID=UPI0021BD726E|nr:prolyl-tRNA synthetase associated domain-containing protein [Ferrimonas balearica]